MKIKLIVFASLLIILALYTHGQELEGYRPYKIEKVQLVQNSCNRNDYLLFRLYGLDTLSCRIDSVFLTDDPFYFHFKSYDSNGRLRFFASIHVHINIKSISELPDADILLSPLYKDCLFFHNSTILNTSGEIVSQMFSTCHYYSILTRGSLLMERIGTDEFGVKNIITNDQIMRMPVSRRK